MELRFIRAERDKTGNNNSTHMIAGADITESIKQDKAIKVKEKKKEDDEIKAKKDEEIAREKKKREIEATRKILMMV